MQKPKLFRKGNNAVKDRKAKNSSWSVRKLHKLASVSGICCSGDTKLNSVNGFRLDDACSRDQPLLMLENDKVNYVNLNVQNNNSKNLQFGTDRVHFDPSSLPHWSNSSSILNDEQLQNSISFVANRLNFLLENSLCNKKRRKSLPSFSSDDQVASFVSKNVSNKLYNVSWNETSRSLRIDLSSHNNRNPGSAITPLSSYTYRTLDNSSRPLKRRPNSLRYLNDYGFCNNQNDVMTPNTDHNEEREKQPSSPSLSVSSKTSNKSRHTKREFRPVSEVTGVYKQNRNKDVVLKWHKIPAFGVVINNEAALAAELEHIDKWGGVDLFKIADLSNNRPLTCVMYTICQKRDMFNKFKLQPSKFLTYIMTLEDHYRDIPYHNRIHAADVAQSVHSLFCIPALDGLFNDLEVLSALIASSLHDVDHPGVTNQYHCSNYTELAMLYNDTSVLEMHHLAVGFKLMLQDHCDLFDHFSRKQWQLLRKMIVDMVLATDMSKHMQLVANLKTMVETKKVASSGILELDQYVDRIEVLKNLVHCADLSNPIKPLELYKQWTERLTNEWWRQGDVEIAIGAEVSPMCDRNNANIEKSQVMFIDFVVYPLVEIWADLVNPDGQDMVNAITRNREYFAGKMPGSPSHGGGKPSSADEDDDVLSDSTEHDPSDCENEPNSDSFRFHPTSKPSGNEPDIYGANGDGEL